MTEKIMEAVISVNPFRCRMWELHDRLEAHVDEQSCKSEIESFEKHGQFVPVLARPVHNDHSFDYELIFGARRLFVAQHLNKPLLAQIREMTDLEAIIAMDIENRQRKDVSPYEQGLCYAQWLRAKYFESQDDIARTLRVSASQVSRLLKVSRLPAVVVNAFSSPLDIREGWGLELAMAWEDPARKSALVERAREIGAMTQRPPGPEVQRLLLASGARGRRLPRSNRDEVVKDAMGNPLFRIRQQRRTVGLLLPIEKVSAPVLNEIKAAIVKALLRQSVAEPADAPSSLRRRVHSAAL